MTTHVLNKSVVIAKERKVLIEFLNSATPDSFEVLTCEVMAIESSKTDLSKYSIILSTNEKKIEIPAETFLYKLTSSRKSKLNENVKYRRNNIWEIEFFIDGERSSSIKIESFDEVIQAVYFILKRNFQFFSEIFETYEYLYFPRLFDVYKKSFENKKEACEKFYETLNNKLKTNSFEEFIEIFEMLNNHHDFHKKDGDICDYFIDCAKNAIPHHFSRYILAEYFTNEQIFDCYGGKDNAIKYLDRVVGNDILDDTAMMINLLKKLTLDKENKQFDNQIYMEHLIKTMETKSHDIFKTPKKSWHSYSDMIYNTVSELMRHEKDKTNRM